MRKWLASHEPEVHLAIVVFWTASIVPTLLWWKNSVLWVALMSLWANIASHWSAHAAAKAGRKVDENGSNTRLRSPSGTFHIRGRQIRPSKSRLSRRERRRRKVDRMVNRQSAFSTEQVLQHARRRRERFRSTSVER
jgi:hypothetical protein